MSILANDSLSACLSLAILDPKVGCTMNRHLQCRSVVHSLDCLFQLQSRSLFLFSGQILSAIPFSRDLSSPLVIFPEYLNFLLFTFASKFLLTPACSKTHEFVFLSVHNTRKICPSRIIFRRCYKTQTCFANLWRDFGRSDMSNGINYSLLYF